MPKQCTPWRERFFPKFIIPANPAACWPWTAGTIEGYGVLKFPDGRNLRAHRLMWILAFDADPGELGVLHKCDQPSCVNPFHLFLGTAADNNADMVAKGRQRAPRQWRGELNARAKLTNVQVADIRARYVKASYHRGNGRELAREYGVTGSTVTAIARNEHRRQ